MRRFFYIIVLLISQLAIAQYDTDFNKANSLYNNGQYQEAISVYESILDEGFHSAELYYNIANAYYKLNSIAPSIYYYEKALLLKPNDKDIKNNLAYAQNMTIDAIENIPEIGFSKFMKSVINLLSFDTWSILSIGFSVFSVVLFLIYYFSYSTLRKRLMFLGSLTAFFLMLISLFLAFQNYNLELKNNPAIIFSQESQVRTDPNLRSENVFILHEGTKIQVLELYKEEWAKIKIANGKTGWISSEDFKTIK